MSFKSDPASRAFAVVPSDASPLITNVRALYVGTGGDIRLTTEDGDTVTLKNVPNGVLPVACQKVWETGTTALDIVALHGN